MTKQQIMTCSFINGSPYPRLQEKINSPPLVSVVVLCFNGSEHLRICLDSLRRSNYPNIEVIAVDNASKDDSVDIINSEYPWAKLIVNKLNLGYTGGNNVGIASAKGKYIFLLNQDTEVDGACINNLVTIMEKDGTIGISTCKILLFYDRRYFHYGGGNYNIMGITLDRGRYEIDAGQYDKTEDTTFANGAAMLIRREVIQKVGALDELFVAYNEDVDISLRAWLCGFRIAYVPSALVFHKLGASFGRLSPIAVFHASKNSLMILLKDFDFSTILTYLPLALFYRLVLVVLNLNARRISETKAVLFSVLWVIRNFRQILVQRHRTRLQFAKNNPNSRFILAKIKEVHWNEYRRLMMGLFTFTEAAFDSTQGAKR